MAGRITSGRVTVRKVEAKPLAKVEVERVRIARKATHGRINSHAKRGEGVLIGGVWVIFTDWTKDRVHYTIDASREIQVNSPVPVTLDS